METQECPYLTRSPSLEFGLQAAPFLGAALRGRPRVPAIIGWAGDHTGSPPTGGLIFSRLLRHYEAPRGTRKNRCRTINYGMTDDKLQMVTEPVQAACNRRIT